MARVFSFGGGLQSFTVAALQHMGKIKPFDAYLYADMGDAEPDTIAYIDEHVSKLNIPFVKVSVPSLIDKLLSDRTSIPIPVYFQGGGIGRRNCTYNHKVVPIDRWIRDHWRNQEVEVGLGFSLDEETRCKPYAYEPVSKIGSRALGYQRIEVYPLIHEYPLSREECFSIIEQVGLPPVPKSACFFCPFKSRTYWVQLRKERPELYEKAVHIEDVLNEKRLRANKDTVSLHPKGRLTESVGDEIPVRDFQDGACNVGHCFT